MEHHLLLYLFLTFTVGVACLGVAIDLARRGDRLTRTFLATYAVLSLMVGATLVLAYADAVPGVLSRSADDLFVYLESIVGLYGVMLTLPLLAHRIFGVERPRRDLGLILVVAVALVVQHITEFALASTVWDHRGDLFEDLLLAGMVAYTFAVGWRHMGDDGVWQPLGRRFLVLLALGLPGTFHDLFLRDATGLILYPLYYCVTSVVMVWTLTQRLAAAGPASGPSSPTEAPRHGTPRDWGLSERETEVALLVARGHSNREIAGALHISPNTVKTHLRTIFEKCEIHSRFELISRLGAAPPQNHPDG